ncbi:MAG TPA: DUF2461 domain-containing protein [Gemmatimonadaceae bacterium]|nr:DUF2461 domain-containing protein [Gemmatimonadaceae bacterium]
MLFSGFPACALTFLKGLKKNNRKEWFEANRETYEHDVREPMIQLVDELDAVLGAMAPELRGDPKKSIFRIYRDVRFSPDKSPYKTHIAAWLFHRDAGSGVGQEAHGGAGMYIHVEPGASMVGGGIWMPPKIALDKIRDRIADDVKGFEKALTSPAFKRRFGSLSEEAMLTRVPRGYDPNHPAGKWLRYKSFTAGRKLADADVRTKKLVSALRKDFETMLPFVRWLNASIGLKQAESR